MDNIYLFMLIAITVLAVADIVVGVSNDAINFLNSAIGSKVISKNNNDCSEFRYFYWSSFF